MKKWRNLEVRNLRKVTQLATYNVLRKRQLFSFTSSKNHTTTTLDRCKSLQSEGE